MHYNIIVNRHITKLHETLTLQIQESTKHNKINHLKQPYLYTIHDQVKMTCTLFDPDPV